MDFRQLRYALAVYKERSFTKAAKRLNISQSAVSEQVKLLEDEIGFELFRRTSRGIESTDRGRTFLYESERVMSDLLTLSDTARRLRGALSDTLTIGMGSGMAQIFIPRMFADLRNRSCRGAAGNPDGADQEHLQRTARGADSTPASRSNRIPTGCRLD